MQPGIYTNISNADYHNGPGISNSGLTQLARSPLHFWSAYLDPRRPAKKETDAMVLGSAIHAAILEPEKFERSYVERPSPEDYPETLVSADDFKSACKAAGLPVSGTKPELRHRLEAAGTKLEFFEDVVARLTANKIVLVPDDYATCLNIAYAVRHHPAAAKLFESGSAETSIYWTDPDTGVLCRARPDWFTGSHIVDLKSTTDASPIGFPAKAYTLRYWVQAALYTDGMKEVTGNFDGDFINLAWEKTLPYAAGFYYYPPEYLAAGRQEYKRLLRIYAECLNKNTWPGYGDLMVPLELPAWAGKRLVYEPEIEEKDWTES